MNRLKAIMLPLQGQNKRQLIWLYNTTTSKCDDDKDKIFYYEGMNFWFAGASHRNSEKLIIYVAIPEAWVEEEIPKNPLPVEHYLLSYLSPMINELSKEYISTVKSVREKAQFSAQPVNEHIVKRNGMAYQNKEKCFVMQINFSVPLVNALSINAKAAVRAVRDILDHILKFMMKLDQEKLTAYLKTYAKQHQIREYIRKNNLMVFVANDSILPRQDNTNQPFKNSVPFKSPKSLQITIPFEDGDQICGMGIPQGITVITGGGYSGKSTLLNAIEMGIYNHVPGDGREFVITEKSALKVYAEDGRAVNQLDMSPFFKYLPNVEDLRCFSTTNSSGSVSQAANIIEAITGGSKVLLIDEDRSATNFMIRDKNMRKIVKHEPIIPFTDRVKEIYNTKGVSTILVIGGSSEYLNYADHVILMDDYIATDITQEVKQLELVSEQGEKSMAHWVEKRYFMPKQTTQPFIHFNYIASEHTKKIVVDEYSADITLLTALVSEEQINTLAYIVGRILADKTANREDLMQVIETLTWRFYENGKEEGGLLNNLVGHGWIEEIRLLDIWCCMNRMRGIVLNEGGRLL